MAALGDMASEEIRDRLDHLPHAILRLAARRLKPSQRITVYQDEWLPELTYILKGAEARPITRLITGTRFALGILAGASRIARHLRYQPTKAGEPSPAGITEGQNMNAAAVNTEGQNMYAVAANDEQAWLQRIWLNAEDLERLRKQTAMSVINNIR